MYLPFAPICAVTGCAVFFFSKKIHAPLLLKTKFTEAASIWSEPNKVAEPETKKLAKPKHKSTYNAVCINAANDRWPDPGFWNALYISVKPRTPIAVPAA